MSSAGLAVRSALVAFGSRPDPRLVVLEPWPIPQRPAAALLASVLGQDLTIAGLARLLREVRTSLAEKSLGATPADWSLLEKFSSGVSWLKDWPHREALAGWILSTSDYLRTHGPPETWPAEFDPPSLVRTLASQLPWMGARSSHRIKAWRLCRWLGRGEIGDMIDDGGSFRANLRVPHSAVERPLRTISALPSQWSAWTPSKRQEWVDGIAFEVSPNDPAAIWPALEIILSRGRSGPACQEFLGGCRSCPLRQRCPSPALG